MQTSRAGADRRLAASRRRRSSCTAPTCASPAPSPRNCLLARRLVERGVRFVQIFHRGWDQHGNLAATSTDCSASDTDQATAA